VITLELDALDTRLAAGIFGEGSLFDKTLRSILRDVPQGQRYDQTVRRRNLARYGQAVREWTRSLQPGLKLSNRECVELSDLIVAGTQPPRRFGHSDYAMVYYQVSKVPEDKLKAILLERQWKELKQGIASWSDAKAFLNREGFEFEREPVRPQTAPALPSEPRPARKPLAPERR
jgi:hypothetical protein